MARTLRLGLQLADRRLFEAVLEQGGARRGCLALAREGALHVEAASLVLGIRALKAAHPMLEDPDERPNGNEPVLLIGESILATARSLQELIAGCADLVGHLTRVDGGGARRSMGSDPDDASF